MDEKLELELDFEKCKMQPLMQNYSYFAFLSEKGSKEFILCRLSKGNMKV